MTCPYCGGSIQGDGITTPLHCENADLPLDVEPYVSVIFCETEETWQEFAVSENSRNGSYVK